MKRYWVYVHTCTANGKKYVGVTTKVKPEYRWGRNGEGYKGQLFGRAIRKYGWSSITHEVFEVESEEEMYRKEIELISFYHSNDPNFGYNNSSGGEKGALGCKYSEEIRKKMSEVRKGKHPSEETKRRMSEAHKGRPLNEEHRKRIAENNRRKAKDPEFRRKISEAHRGKTVSEESRKKMAESHRGKPLKPFSEEHRKHIAEARKGKLRSEETRKKLSEINKKRWADPEYRRKQTEAHKGKSHKPHKPFSEETKRRMSEAKKGKPQPRIKIKLPDGTIVEITKQLLARNYVNKGKKFEYVS